MSRGAAMRPAQNFRRAFVIIALMVVAAFAITAGVGGSALLSQTAHAQQEPGAVPGGTLGAASDTDLWRSARQGVAGTVAIPDKKAAILIQSEGETWRSIRNGPLSIYGIWALIGIVVVTALFFAVRGRIRVEAGPSGRTLVRFNGLERFSHWLMAGSFIILGLTGLNMLYGRYVLKPVIGPEAYSAITMWGKIAHNYIAFSFMVGVALAFVLWVAHNIPNRQDLAWIARGGGIFKKGVHPPARKFNAGQKLIFWIVVLGGLSISLSGIALMFPFETRMFSGTFAVLNIFGFGLPTDLSLIQEQQLNQLWHGIVGLFLIVVVIAHIYIGTVGMQGAFDAMGSGRVDENWAKEHHSIWYAEKTGGPVPQTHDAATSGKPSSEAGPGGGAAPQRP